MTPEDEYTVYYRKATLGFRTTVLDAEGEVVTFDGFHDRFTFGSIRRAERAAKRLILWDSRLKGDPTPDVVRHYSVREALQ